MTRSVVSSGFLTIFSFPQKRITAVTSFFTVSGIRENSTSRKGIRENSTSPAYAVYRIASRSTDRQKMNTPSASRINPNCAVTYPVIGIAEDPPSEYPCLCSQYIWNGCPPAPEGVMLS